MADGIIYIAALVACAAAAELVTRRRMPRRERMPPGLFAPHGRLGFTLNPGFAGTSNHGIEYRINRYGFRDFDRDLATRAGARTLALGNSFAMGIGEPLEETYLHLLEQRLREEDAGSEVVKAGVGGYGTRHELLYYEEIGPQVAADAVLLLFHIGTDFRNNRTEIRATVRGGRLIPTYRYNRLKSAFEDHCMLYTGMRRALRGQSPIARGLGRLGIVNRAYPQRLQLFAATDATIPGWEDTRSALDGFRTATAARGSRLLLCVIPDKLQIDRDDFTRQIEFLDAEPDAYAVDRPNKVLSTWCRETGTDLLDLTEPFRALQQDARPPFLEDDIHWSLAGRSEAAALTARRLEGRA